MGDVGSQLRRDGSPGTQASEHGADEVLSTPRRAHSYTDTTAWHKYSA